MTTKDPQDMDDDELKDYLKAQLNDLRTLACLRVHYHKDTENDNKRKYWAKVEKQLDNAAPKLWEN